MRFRFHGEPVNLVRWARAAGGAALMCGLGVACSREVPALSGSPSGGGSSRDAVELGTSEATLAVAADPVFECLADRAQDLNRVYFLFSEMNWWYLKGEEHNVWRGIQQKLHVTFMSAATTWRANVHIIRGITADEGNGDVTRSLFRKFVAEDVEVASSLLGPVCADITRVVLKGGDAVSVEAGAGEPATPSTTGDEDPAKGAPRDAAVTVEECEARHAADIRTVAAFLGSLRANDQARGELGRAWGAVPKGMWEEYLSQVSDLASAIDGADAARGDAAPTEKPEGRRALLAAARRSQGIIVRGYIQRLGGNPSNIDKDVFGGLDKKR